MLRYPGSTCPRRDPGLPSCLHRKDPPASVKCVSLPVGCLGSPFRRSSTLCRLTGLLPSTPPGAPGDRASEGPQQPPALRPLTFLGFDCTVSAPKWLYPWLRPTLLCLAPFCPEAGAAALTTSVILRTSGWAAAPPHRMPPTPDSTAPRRRAREPCSGPSRPCAAPRGLAPPVGNQLV